MIYTFFSINSSESNGTNIKTTYSNSNTTYENKTETSYVNSVSNSEYDYGSGYGEPSKEEIEQLVSINLFVKLLTKYFYCFSMHTKYIILCVF